MVYGLKLMALVLDGELLIGSFTLTLLSDFPIDSFTCTFDVMSKERLSPCDPRFYACRIGVVGIFGFFLGLIVYYLTVSASASGRRNGKTKSYECLVEILVGVEKPDISELVP